MVKGAFGAGFAKGFGTTLAAGIEDRRRERNRYLDTVMDNARAAAPGLAASDAEVDAYTDMMKQMEQDFGITSEEFIGLAQNYDINQIYKNVYTAKSVMDKNGIGGVLDKSLILGGLKIPEQYELPKGVTPENALRMIFQGTVANTNPSNKSEAHKAGAVGKAISEVLMLNPRASAKDMTEGMRIAGVPIERLLQFQANAGVKRSPFEQLKADGPFQAIDIDYTDAKYAQTTRTFASVFSRKFAGAADVDTLQSSLAASGDLFAAAQAQFGKDSTPNSIYSSVYDAGQTFANLEKQLIAKGLSQGMGGNNLRSAALQGVAARLENAGEMTQLVNAIKAGDPVADRILEAFEKDQMITDREMDYILTGQRSEEEQSSSATDSTIETSELPDVTPMPQPEEFVLTQEEQLERAPALPTQDDPMDIPELAPVPDPLSVAEDAPVSITLPKDLISEDNLFTANLKQMAAEQGINMNETGARARAAQLEVIRAAFKPQMQKITYEQWDSLSRQERRERGLPESPFDVAMYGGGAKNFKPQPTANVEPGSELSRLDADGNVKPEVAELERIQLASDIDAAIIDAAKDDMPQIDSIFDAQRFAEGWLENNLPEAPESYDPRQVAQAIYDYFTQSEQPQSPTDTTVAPEVNSIVDDMLSD